jgi:hypothetical protein
VIPIPEGTVPTIAFGETMAISLKDVRLDGCLFRTAKPKGLPDDLTLEGFHEVPD